MNTYITICTSDAYVPGVIALAKSLKRTGTSIPLRLLTTRDISQTNLDALTREGIELLFAERIIPGEHVRRQNELNGSPNWNNTFFKLRIFGLIQFNKLVYLDSDMVVTDNIDELFNKPHMSAVQAGRGFEDDWRQLNSGLMVIEPNAELEHDLLSLVTDDPDPRMLNGKGIGDQDIINWYYRDWPEREELHLPETYNQFVTLIPQYLRTGKLETFEDVKVIHFVGRIKPWNYGVREYLRIMARAIRWGSFQEFHAVKLFKEL